MSPLRFRAAHRFEASLEGHKGERAEQGVAEDEHAYAKARQQPRSLRGGSGAAAATAAEQLRASPRSARDATGAIVVVVAVVAASTGTTSRRPLIIITGVLHRIAL